MSKEQQPLRTIFNEALEIADAQQRADYLKAACGADTALLQRIEELIDANHTAEGFLGGAGDTVAKSARDILGTLMASEKPGEPALRQFGDYELLEEIARGGMGIVYKARQVSLDRVVAVKLLLLGQYASEEFIHRFRIEASAAASLQHPNIVAIHEVGVHQGQHYFAMDFVDGPNLAQLVRDQPLTAKRAAGYVKTIAEAIHFAHTRRILHRDLKPSNVLIDANDQPRVTDFGLAKNLANDSELTLSGQVMGSPGYMPPEQALGERGKMGPASDVYSLGAILYHALTGRAPFVGETVGDTLQQVQSKEPIAPRLLIPAIPVDLETICLRCLEKESGKRFASAQDLADELGRFLRDEPIHARPISRVEKAWRWCRRKPELATLSAAIILLLLAVAVGSSVAALRIQREVLRVTKAEQTGREKLWQSYLEQARAGRWSGRASSRFDSLEALAKAAAIRPALELRNEAIACTTLVDIRTVRHWPNLHAYQRMCMDRSGERYAESDAAGNIDIRAVRDDRTILQLKTPGTKVQRIFQFSHHGQFLAARYADSLVRVWDLERREIILRTPSGSDPRAVDFSPEDRELAVASGAGGAVIHALAPGHQTNAYGVSRGVRCVRFSPDGKKLAAFCTTRGSRILIIDLESQTVGSSLMQGEEVGSFDWHPDGRHLAVFDSRLILSFVDVVTGKVEKELEGVQAFSIKFNPTGTMLATTAWDSKTRLWSYPSGNPLVSAGLAGHNLQFSPDGRKLSHYGWDGWNMTLFEVVPGGERRGFPARTPALGAIRKPLAFCPGADWLAYAADETITLRDHRSDREVKLEAGSVYSLSFSKGGEFLFVSGNLGLARWPLQRLSEKGERLIGPPQSFGPPGAYAPSCLSADGRTFAAILGDRAHVFDAGTLAEIAQTEVLGGLNRVALSPDGQQLAMGLWKQNAVVISNARTGQRIQTLSVRESANVGFTPDGKWLVTSAVDECQFWNTGSWTRGLRLDSVEAYDIPSELAFSGDGTMMAITHSRDIVHLINPATGEMLGALEVPDSNGTTGLSFSDDGSQLAVAGGFPECVVWDLRAIRVDLKQINLDWNMPPFAPEKTSTSTSPALVLLAQDPVQKARELTAQLLKYPARALGTKTNSVDLSLHYNVALTNMPHSGHASNDLSFLPGGMQHFGGVDFDIRGVVQLASGLLPGQNFPRHVRSIPVSAKCDRLHFLHSCMFGNSSLEGREIGHYVVHYSKGQDQIVPIIYGHDVIDWWAKPEQSPQIASVVAWTGISVASQQSKQSIQLFKQTWKNPHPKLEVRAIEFVSSMTPASPFLIAITAEP